MDTDFIPVGRGASAHGTESGGEEEEDEMAWEPDRDPLDLPDWCDVERAASPAPSYLSMESGGRMDCSTSNADPDDLTTRIELERPDSCVSSIYSLESDDDVEKVMKPELRVRKKPKVIPYNAAKPELAIDPSHKRHPALTVKFTFKFLQEVLKKLSEPHLKFFKKYLWERYPEFFRDPLDGLDIIDLVDKMLECCDIELALKITTHVIQYMGQKNLVEYITGHLQRNEVRWALRQQLKEQYRTIYEGCPKDGGSADFESVYAEHHMTLGMYAPPNNDHELRGAVSELKVEPRYNYKPLKNTELYVTSLEEQKYLRLLVMRGAAGGGKSAAAQRYILDWAWETAHEHIYFVFPLSGAEFLATLDVDTTFHALLSARFPCVAELTDLDFEDCQVLFIMDDVDELVYELDFLYTHCWCDMNTTVKTRLLLINLIKGNLLHSSYLWMVLRALASCELPNDRISQVVEVRGFAEEAREVYFRKRHSDDPALAERMVAYLRANETLFIMCHLPLFCWVVSNVLQKVFRKFPPGQEPPSTITEMYTRLVQVYFNKRERRRSECGEVGKKWEDDRGLMMKMGKVAYTMLEKEIFQMVTSHWKEDEVDPQQVIVHCGLVTEYYREKYILYQEKLRCFVHPSVQEYMAALYVFLSYKNGGKNVMDTSKMAMIKLRDTSLADLYKHAIEKAGHSKASAKNHYDLFLRFLVGLGAESNQRILGSFINHVGCKASAMEDAVKLLRKKSKDNPALKKCLDELSHLEG